MRPVALRKLHSRLDSGSFEGILNSMTYVTIEAEIANGQIVPRDSTNLPEHGRALVTLLPETPRRTDWDKVESVIGSLRRPDLDSAAWQREVRTEWDRP